MLVVSIALMYRDTEFCCPPEINLTLCMCVSTILKFFLKERIKEYAQSIGIIKKRLEVKNRDR